MIAPDHYPLVRHAELVREAELDAAIRRRHPQGLRRRRGLRPVLRRRTTHRPLTRRITR